ncbi:ribonuclease III domain-containing protein [Cladochytrium replicatum]|nr:ribonuclease III domain-containing protein [Cladochytrium replicatum]
MSFRTRALPTLTQHASSRLRLARSLTHVPNTQHLLSQLRATSRPRAYMTEAAQVEATGSRRPLGSTVEDPLSSKEYVAKLSAFTARSGIELGSDGPLVEALTHVSYRRTTNNQRLSYLGEKAAKLFVTEQIFSRYPKLPADALESIVKSYTERRVLANIGKALGVPAVMLWQNSGAVKQEGQKEGAMNEGVISAKATFALIGVLYQKSPLAARKFVHAHILSRDVDVETHLKLQGAKSYLPLIMRERGKPRPVSRLIRESGRLSTSPVFLVGIYSGAEKIGEGYGSSLSEAEFRAAKNALSKHFMTDLKKVELPSEHDFVDDSDDGLQLQ